MKLFEKSVLKFTKKTFLSGTEPGRRDEVADKSFAKLRSSNGNVSSLDLLNIHIEAL